MTRREFFRLCCGLASIAGTPHAEMTPATGVDIAAYEKANNSQWFTNQIVAEASTGKLGKIISEQIRRRG